jgi:hypothetical protein
VGRELADKINSIRVKVKNILSENNPSMDNRVATMNPLLSFEYGNGCLNNFHKNILNKIQLSTKSCDLSI